jgi:hypothetical protein
MSKSFIIMKLINKESRDNKKDKEENNLEFHNVLISVYTYYNK